MATSSEMYVGIDVSKDRLDVAVLGENRKSRWMQYKGMELTSWCDRCMELQPELIVVEATGGYQRGSGGCIVSCRALRWQW